MEHIVQFAVNIDDERIQSIMEQSAAKQITEEIKQAAHGLSWSTTLNKEPENIKAIFKEEVANYVKENADVILKMAVEEVAKNFTKTKKFKEATEEL